MRQFPGCAAAVIIAALVRPAIAQPEPSPATMLRDAELTAVTFVDPDRGWVVGDRGVIWNTSDGGRSWQLQNSGVTCRLEAVQFHDANNGWIVGGWIQPYTHETHGVVLRTKDGGRTWQIVPGQTLPGLTGVRFIDHRRGWAFGNGSALFPAGVFHTDDGGRTWTPIMKGESQGWVTGDFRNERSGVVAGLSGETASVASSGVRANEPPQLGGRYVRRLRLSSETTGWLVGDGGLVLKTEDGGATWDQAESLQTAGNVSPFDFRALALHGNHIWAAGAPGTCVLHSPDAGQTWRLLRTEQTAPLRGLCFIDEYRGWAVGSLGTILHTRDGGQTWRLQQSGGKRVALLGIFSRPQCVPLELIAQESGSDAHLAAIEIVGRPDAVSDSRGAGLAIRTQAAIVTVGGSAAETAWQFPLPEEGLQPTPDTILSRWHPEGGAQAVERLEEHLVRRIRQWRPEVIVTEDVSPRGEQPLAHLINQITLAAAQKAEQPDQYEDQILSAGLAPWRVKKVFAVAASEKQGAVNITPAQWAPRLGRSLADMAQMGRSLLCDEVNHGPQNIGLSLLVDHLPQASGRRSIMAGINLTMGGDVRRELAQTPQSDLEALSRAAQKRHNVEQLLARVGSGKQDSAVWLSQIDELTSGMSNRQAGEILFQLGQQCHRSGKWRSAAEAFELLVKQYPQHPLADASARWLLRYYASGEVAHRERNATQYAVQLVSATTDAASPPAATDQSDTTPPAQPSAGVQSKFSTVRESAGPLPGDHEGHRAGLALGLAKSLERTRPELMADPAIRHQLAAATRRAGQPRQAEKLVLTLASQSSGDWRNCAQVEDWLTNPKAAPPKKVISVVTALSKPRLDGRLDEPLWQVAKAVSLQTSDPALARLPAAAVMAFDDEFLYVAVSCRKVEGVDYTSDDSSRPSDSDLAASDGVTIQLDIDRDYASWWQLSIDHRGRLAAECFGDASWNPQWFVAAGGDAEWWTAEAAIPLSELASKRPVVRDVWAVGIQRVAPTLGVQSLSLPATLRVRPEAFSLLVFE